MFRFLWIPTTGLLLLFSAFSACQKNDTSMMPAPQPTTNDTASGKTFLALGDSYTIGQSVQAAERFPYLTAQALRSQGINVQDPRYIAVTGWTTLNLQAGISQQNPPPTYDVVTLLIGVNDQYQHRDTAEYRTRFTQLLEKSIALAGGRSSHVFVLSIPDYSATPFVAPVDKTTVSAQVGWFNAINRQITLQYNISYTDITPLSREVTSDPTLLAPDDLHYSGKEYGKWAALLAPAVRNSF